MKTVIEMAREAWISDKEAEMISEFDGYISCTYLADLEAFAELVRADEREAAEERVVDLFIDMETPYLLDITAAIQARNNT